MPFRRIEHQAVRTAARLRGHPAADLPLREADEFGIATCGGHGGGLCPGAERDREANIAKAELFEDDRFLPGILGRIDAWHECVADAEIGRLTEEIEQG